MKNNWPIIQVVFPDGGDSEELHRMTKKDFTQKAIEPKRSGRFLQYVSDASLGDRQNRDKIGELLVILHNSEDLITEAINNG